MRVRDLTRAVLAAGAFGLAGGAAEASDQPMAAGQPVVTAAPPAALLAAGPVGSVAPGGCATCGGGGGAVGGCASCNRAKAASKYSPYNRPVYPRSEQKYDRAYAHPSIAPGSCFGYFKTQWSSWPEVCPGWPVDPVAQSIYAPRVPKPTHPVPAADTTPPTPTAPAPTVTPQKDGGTAPPANPMPPAVPPTPGKSGLNSAGAPAVPVPQVPATSPIRY